LITLFRVSVAVFVLTVRLTTLLGAELFTYVLMKNCAVIKNMSITTTTLLHHEEYED
jgi:hypothetical protein